MIEFMRGIRTPLSTTLIPVSARIASNRAGYLPSRSRMRYRASAAGVLQVHDQVPGGLGHPGGGRVRGGAEDADPAGGVLDDGEDVHPGAGQRDGFEEVGGEEASACERRNVAQVVEVRSGAGSMPASRRISQTVDAATLTPRTSSSPWMRR